MQNREDLEALGIRDLRPIMLANGIRQVVNGHQLTKEEAIEAILKAQSSRIAAMPPSHSQTLPGLDSPSSPSPFNEQNGTTQPDQNAQPDASQPDEQPNDEQNDEQNGNETPPPPSKPSKPSKPQQQPENGNPFADLLAQAAEAARNLSEQNNAAPIDAEELDAIKAEARAAKIDAENARAQAAAANANAEAAKKAAEAAARQKPINTTININGQLASTLKDATPHAALPEVLEYLQCGLTPYLIGPAGCGKTTAAEQAALVLFPEDAEEVNGHKTSRKFTALSCSDDLSTGDIYGRLTPVEIDGKKAVKFIKAPFLDLYENGGVILLDEIDAGAPEVLISVNKALAQSSIDVPNAGRIHRHPKCYIIAAGNTTGHGASADYCGRSRLDGATLNRFTYIRTDYDTKLEDRIIDANTANPEDAKTVKEARRRIRAAIKQTNQKGIFFSTRQCSTYSVLTKTGRVKTVSDIAAHFARAIDDEGSRARFLSAI